MTAELSDIEGDVGFLNEITLVIVFLEIYVNADKPSGKYDYIRLHA